MARLFGYGSALPPPRTIHNMAGEAVYIARHYLSGGPSMPDGSSPFDEYGDPKPEVIWKGTGGGWLDRKLGISGRYIHHIRRSDEDRELHDHPWAWAVSLILAGGYREFRRVTVSPGIHDVDVRVFRPGSVNVLCGTDFHRLDLLDEKAGAWTLFIVGPRIKDWGFWNRVSGSFTHWRDFINKGRDATSFARPKAQ